MSEQIKILNLPTSDISNPNFEINIYDAVASDTGQAIVDYMRNRNLTSAWATTGSSDIGMTRIECVSGDAFNVTDIMLVGHNFKAFAIEYFDGMVWILLQFYTHNADDFTHLSIDSIETTGIRIIVYETMTANEDKIMVRLVITNKIESGQFVSWPIIDKPTQQIIRKESKMLSGKSFISESAGAFSVKLKWDGGINNQNDIDIIERMFLYRRPFMIWLSGGDETQFRFTMIGYRRQDLYIMKCKKDYTNGYYKGMYGKIVPQTIELIEVVE